MILRSAWLPLIALALVALALAGCASSAHQPTAAQEQFMAGQEAAFATLQRSGIAIVRVVGPFARPVVLWHQGMTVAQVILEAGYLEQRKPTQILIQRGPTAIEIDPATLLRGQDVPVEAGDVVNVVP